MQSGANGNGSLAGLSAVRLTRNLIMGSDGKTAQVVAREERNPASLGSRRGTALSARGYTGQLSG